MGVYKEGKNWKVQVYYKDWQGNQKRKQKRGFRTKGEAKEWERDFLQQQSQGVDIEFGNFLEIYYKDMDVRLREHTMYTKRYIIDLKIRPYFEKKILSEITVADVRAWQNELLMYKDKNGKGYSQTYLKTINCQLTAIFNYAIRYYNLQDNPCRKAGAIGKSKGEPKDFWMQEEFNNFLETVSDKPETRMAFLLLYWTGMRIGELLALTYDDINLEEKLYYNDQNDRIATWISQYKADNKINSIDMKNKEEYNNIIHQFITESNPKALSKTQKNIALVGQEQPGVVLADGRIVDGNRRFTCLRNIQEETGNTQYMNAVILERDITGNAKEIKMLELYLQHGVDKPVDYDSIDRLVGIYNDIVDKKLLSITEYAKSVNLSEREIKREVDKAKLMVEFLEFIDAPKQFHLARKLNINDPLKELNTIMKQCKDEDRREDLKNVFFANLLIRPKGDATRYVRDIKKIAIDTNFLDNYLEEQMELTEKVCDLLEECGDINEEVINEKILTQNELQNAFEHSTEKWVTKSNSKASKTLPAQLIEKAYEQLDNVDTNVFKKLSDDEKDNIRSKLDLVQEMIDSIRGELDV